MIDQIRTIVNRSGKTLVQDLVGGASLFFLILAGLYLPAFV